MIVDIIIKIMFTIQMNALKRTFEFFGSQSALAEALDLTPMAVSNWKKRGKIPVGRAIQIERLTKGEVTRRDLRPDLFEDAA